MPETKKLQRDRFIETANEPECDGEKSGSTGH